MSSAIINRHWYYMPILAIAFEVGYEELSTFYRAYKKHTGLNPLKLRKGRSIHEMASVHTKL